MSRVESRVTPSRWVPLLFMIPLVILTAGLGYEQFRREKESLLADMTNLTAEQHYAVNSMLDDADRQLTRMRVTIQHRLAEQGVSAAPRHRDELEVVDIKVGDRITKGVQLRRYSPDRGNIIGVPDLLDRSDEKQGALDAALSLLPQLFSEAAASRLSSWSYFFSSSADFIIIRPGASLQEFMDASNAQNPVKSVEELVKLWLTYDIFVMGMPKNNPKGESYWTDAYMDAGGSGMMISHGMPVSVNGKFLGIVGTDINLNSFSSVLNHMRKPLGYTVILGRKNQILGVEGASFGGQRGQMRAHFEASGIAGLSQQSSGRFEQIGDDFVLSRSLGNSPFRMLYILPSDELYQHFLPRFAAYALILGAVAATLFAVFYYLHRSFVAPSLALTDFVRSSVAGNHPQLPKLPKRWQRQLEAISEAFVAARNYREKLEASEARYRAVINTQTELVARLDPEGRTTFANDAYCRFHGMTLDEVLDRSESDFETILEEDRPIHDAHIASLTPEKPVATIVIRSRIPGGEGIRWEEWTDTGIFDETGKLVEIQCVGRDVTDKRAAEQALAENQTRFTTFLQYAPVAVLSKDLEGRFTMVNPETAKRLGRRPEDIVGRTTDQILPKEEAAVMDRSVARVIETGQMEMETQHHPSLAPYLHSLFIRFPLRNQKGEIDGVGVFSVDRTQEVASAEEMERQREALHQTEKIAALGSLLAGIAHELNNPLAIVVGYAEILREMSDDDQTRSRAAEIHQAASRCARIVRTFLAMARAKPAEKRKANVPTIMSEVLELAGYGLRSNGIEVVHEIADGLRPVFADVDQLHQVFMNVVINAQQAMMTSDADRRIKISYAMNGKSVVIDVADSGEGVTEEVRRRAFEPFFTTKPQGVGTGIGLAVCRNIMTAHGGSIVLLPNPAGGTICRITLPAMADERTASLAAGQEDHLLGFRGRILIVDDEPAIASFLRELMRIDGLDVTVAMNGSDALDKVRQGHFDAVLTDLRMPDMGGTKLVERILEIRPGLKDKIVVMTGDALAAEVELKESGLPFLEKPIEMAVLRKTLNSLFLKEAS